MAAAAMLLLAALPSRAQEGGAAARALTVTPTASVRETITDNVLLDDARKRSDSVTELSVGVRLASRGRVRASLDYQLTGSVHARSSEENSVVNALRAAVNATVIDNFLFLDGSASISQQAVSAFGVQTTNATFDNRNRTEVRSFSLTPSLRGMVGNFARYDVRYTHGQQSSAAGNLGDSTDDTVSATLRSAGASRVGWALSALQQRTEFDAGRSTTTKNVKGALSYRASPDLNLSASGGREWSDLLRSADGGRNTWGLGLEWTPTERTRLNAQREHRFFGNSHLLSFEHRMKRSTWRFSSSEDISTSSPSFVTTGSTAIFDLQFANFASMYPDAQVRTEKVLEWMQSRGFTRDAKYVTGFLQSAVTLNKRQELGVALVGPRTTLTLSAARTETRRLDEVAVPRDDLSVADRVKQQAFSATFGYQLNPTDSLNLLLLQQRTEGSTADQRNELRSLSLNWAGRLGNRATVAFGARRAEFDSPTTPYTENSIFATLGVRF